MQSRKPLVLIRHGQAEHHVRDITGGWSDTKLTGRGIQQAQHLAQRLKNELGDLPLTLGSSNLWRAVQTARIIGEALGVAPQIYPQLADLNNGVAAGKTHSQAKTYAIPPQEPLLDWQPYPQAESWRQFYMRISDFMEEISANLETAAILVTHSATIHAIVAWWLELPVESNTRFDATPASITVLNTSKWGERVIERLNDTAHLYAQGLVDPMQ